MSKLLIRCGKLPYQRVDPFTMLAKNVTGTNVGNMLFQQAVVKSLSMPDYELASNGYDLKVADADRINDSCDVLVLPLANQFRPNFGERLLAMADTIRRLKVPVVVVGVGCQTDLDYDFTKLEAVNEPVKRFVAAVLDHSSSIGVRGVCTAEYLKSLGFDDVDIIGCPSMFMDGPELKRPREIEAFDRSTRLSVNISAFGEQAKFSTGLDKMGDVIAHVVSTYDDVDCVTQQRDSLMALLLGSARQTREVRGIPRDSFRVLHESGRVLAFVDPRTWFEHLAGRQFVLGTRLHGGIAALLAGTPAYLVAHDSRTLELAQYHAIPHTGIRSVIAGQDPRDWYESSDYSAMLRGHPDRFAAYADFLNRNGLRNVFSDGDGGAAFEARMSAVDLPPRIASSTGSAAARALGSGASAGRLPTRAGSRQDARPAGRDRRRANRLSAKAAHGGSRWHNRRRVYPLCRARRGLPRGGCGKHQAIRSTDRRPEVMSRV